MQDVRQGGAPFVPHFFEFQQMVLGCPNKVFPPSVGASIMLTYRDKEIFQQGK